MIPFLEAAWAAENPIMHGREIEANRKITALAVDMGLLERLGANLIPASIHHEYDLSPGHWSR